MSAPRAASVAEHCFVVPPLDGPITGGTLYNRELTAALRAQGASIRVLVPTATEPDDAFGALSAVWVDSLYLEQAPELKQRSRRRLGLIVHYLPSLVVLGRAATTSELSCVERRALLCADAFLVPSAFMRDTLEALEVPKKKPIFVVEPGTHARLSPASRQDVRSELSVVLLGNVVRGKGIEPFLQSLAGLLQATDRLHVSIIGSLRAEPDYAEGCQRLVSGSPALAERVAFLGALAPPEALAWLARSDLFVSASRMESYGIALNEARVLGVPILARSGGNAAAHVDPQAGGELATSDDGLARACIALLRQPALHAERVARARLRAPQARPWCSAAREFTAQLAEWEK